MNLNIYIVEDDKEACERFISVAENFSDFSIVGATDSSSIAYDYILTNNPDVVILDLELNCGIGSGLELIDKINKLNSKQKPYVVVTTNTSNPTTYSYAHENGVGFIFSKHQSGYSELYVLNQINLVKKSISYCRSQTINNSFIDKSSIESTLRGHIMDTLDSLGINVASKGYKYLTDAIYYTMFNENDKQTFEHLSQKYNKSMRLIEQAIRNAILSAWSRKDSNRAREVFPDNLYQGKDYPSPSTFIYFYAERLKNEHLALVEQIKDC